MTRHASLADRVPAGASAEHSRLAVFIGRWRTEGTTVAQPDTPAVRIRSNDHYEWLPGGHFVVHRWDGHVGDADVHGIELIGCDPVRKGYRTHFFDNEGNTGTEQLTVSGRTWTWIGESVLGSDWHRCTSTVSDDGESMQAHHEKSGDGKTWIPWMDVTLRRTRNP